MLPVVWLRGPRSKTHEGYAPSSRFALYPSERKQHASKFSDRLSMNLNVQSSKFGQRIHP